MHMSARFDPTGRMAWVGLMIVGFVFFWPVGLAALAFLTWSGKMSCWSMEGAGHWQQRMMERRRERHRWAHHCGRSSSGNWASGGNRGSSGNRAFDEYRTETLRRLEEEEHEFREFLDRLRFAKDKAEFDSFLAQRRDQPPPAPTEET